jgi:type I restriction enzyme S subunit
VSLTLKPYPEYKAFGLPWLGEIPKEWRVGRLDRLFSLRSESPQEDDQRVTGYLDGRVTFRSNVKGQKIKGVIKEGGWQRVYPGDFAISGMNAHLGGMGVSDALGKCSPIYLVLKPRPATNAQFVSHVVRHIAHSGVLKSLVNTIRFNSADFKRDDLKSIRVWLPSTEEQERIVRFLAHADRRITRLIRGKRQLIGLLNEQKRAIIQRAVTRGLDPNVRLKPSGVDWLGDVPEHWEVLRLKWVAQLHRGYDLPDSRRTEGDYPVVSSGGIIGRHAEFMVAGPGVVTGRYGSTGRVYYIESDYWAHNTALYVSDFHGNVPRYVYYLLHTLAFGAHSGKSAVPGIDRKDLHQIAVPVPPVSEQQRMVESLDAETSGVEATTLEVERTIGLIREYRARLIADVVTGKLDVRGVELPAIEAEEALEDWKEVSEEEADEIAETEEMADADE